MIELQSVILVIVVFAVLGVIAALLALGALVMWTAGRVPGRRWQQWMALSVCGAFAVVGFLSVTSWTLGLLHRSDKRRIDHAYIKFHEALRDRDFNSAYACMSPDYRARYSLSQFAKRFADWAGRHNVLEPGRSLSVSGRTARLYPQDSGDSPPSGAIYKFVKIGNDWYFTGEHDQVLD